ncbi:MAG: FMN-binding protein [Lachnospiraceae bacterium]|nr:FMN-binding protein [Lachnospiraceae bacterium]
MIFLISLIIAALFVLFAGERLRKHPVPYYLGAAALTLGVIGLDFAGIRAKGFMAEWVMPVLTKGALSGAIFVMVMWGGALPNGHKLLKCIMPVRGQLSILACILVFAHAVTFRTYILSLFTNPGKLKGTVLVASICSLLLLLIMLPLFVTSFKAVRRKMNPRKWKALQRTAYVFYGLILGHILFFTYRNVLLGRENYRLNAVIYTYVFLTYGICRILKAVAVKKKDQSKLGMNQLKAVALCATGIMILTVALFGKEEFAPSIKETAKASVVDAVTARDDSWDINDTMTEETADTVDQIRENEEKAGYEDGTYTGTAFGNSGDITVAVTVKDDIITNIEILEQEEDEPYFTDALEVIPKILEANSFDVDTVSGATFSSGGIIDAVKNALDKAEK